MYFATQSNVQDKSLKAESRTIIPIGEIVSRLKVSAVQRPLVLARGVMVSQMLF